MTFIASFGLNRRFGAVGLAKVHLGPGRVGPARRLIADSRKEPPPPLTASELLNDRVPRRLARMVIAGVALGTGGRRFSARKVLVRVKATSPAEPGERHVLVGRSRVRHAQILTYAGA